LVLGEHAFSLWEKVVGGADRMRGYNAALFRKHGNPSPAAFGGTLSPRERVVPG
jgi:hypothetical protein